MVLRNQERQKQNEKHQEIAVLVYRLTALPATTGIYFSILDMQGFQTESLFSRRFLFLFGVLYTIINLIQSFWEHYPKGSEMK